MKILYLCMDRGIDVGGLKGGSIHVRAFIRALADLGHEVVCVCTKLTLTESVRAELRSDVRSSPAAPWNGSLDRFLRAANRFLRRDPRRNVDAIRALHNLTFYKAAAAAARRFDPDLIYERYSLWGMAGLRLAKRRSVPIVLEVNAPLAYEDQHYRAGLTCPPIARRVERAIWRRVDALVTVSQQLSNHLEKTGVEPARIFVLPNAVDTQLFRAGVDGAPVRKRFGLDGRFVIGFVGTFKPWHGIDLLLEAFRDLHQTNSPHHLLLVGDGPLRPQFEEQVQKHGLRDAVTFAGAVEHGQMPCYIAAMDVAAAPYPALEEFYYSPLKLFEYMAMGRPVVAARIGQVADVVTDGVNGLLFEPGDAQGLARCIRRLEEDRSLREELGKKATAACAMQTWSSNAARLIQWVEPLTARLSPVTTPPSVAREAGPRRSPALKRG